MTKEEIIKHLHEALNSIDVTFPYRYVFVEAIEALSNPPLTSNLDEAAVIVKELAFKTWSEGDNWSDAAIKTFKAGAEWMAGQGWSLDGEIKDQPTRGDDFEIYLDYGRDKMEDILDEICDYVNANYPDDNNRYKVIIQIRKKQ